MVQQPTLPKLVRGEWVPMTSEAFDLWVPDGMQAEWVEGEGIIFVSTSTLYGELAVFFTELLRRYLLLFALRPGLRRTGGIASPAPRSAA